MRKAIVLSLFLSAFTGVTFAQQGSMELLKKWVDIDSNEIGAFSVRAVGNDFHDSLFKNESGDYQWWMRVDYKNPKGKVAYEVMYGYFNCDENQVSFDETIRYTKRGVVVKILGAKGGDRQLIPNTPDSVAEHSLKFICSVRFDK